MDMPPGELVTPPKNTSDNTADPTAIDLTKMSLPDSTGATSPVWRLAISEGPAVWSTPGAKLNAAWNNNLWSTGGTAPVLPDPDDPFAATKYPGFTFRRLVYFTAAPAPNNFPLNPPGMTGTPDVFYPSSGTATPVEPGCYAVIGPGSQDTTASGLTVISAVADGNETSAGGPTVNAVAGNSGASSTGASPNNATARLIKLNQVSASLTQQLEVYNFGTKGLLHGGGTSMTADICVLANDGVIRPPVALVINSPNRLNVSEPGSNSGYTLATNSHSYYPAAGYNSDGTYKTAIWDHPLDRFLGGVGGGVTPVNAIDGSPNVWNNFLKFDAIHFAYAVVYLQRLADPLKPYNVNNPAQNNPSQPNYYNPYLTIDKSTVDLTSYNGAAATSDNVKTFPGGGNSVNRSSGTTTPPSKYSTLLATAINSATGYQSVGLGTHHAAGRNFRRLAARSPPPSPWHRRRRTGLRCGCRSRSLPRPDLSPASRGGDWLQLCGLLPGWEPARQDQRLRFQRISDAFSRRTCRGRWSWQPAAGEQPELQLASGGTRRNGY